MSVHHNAALGHFPPVRKAEAGLLPHCFFDESLQVRQLLNVLEARDRWQIGVPHLFSNGCQDRGIAIHVIQDRRQCESRGIAAGSDIRALEARC